MPPETLANLSDSLTRERIVKGAIVVCLFIGLVIAGERAHPFVAIALFALLADLFALNRLRRLVATLESEARQVDPVAAATAEDEP